MPVKDALVDLLGHGPATALREALALSGQTVECTEHHWTARGYTNAVLAEVEIAPADPGNGRKQRCIVKLCPPVSGRPEASRQADALQASYRPEFVKNHLAAIAFQPITCPDGEIVVVQRIAGGDLKRIRPLSRFSVTQFAGVCAAVRAGLLEDWAGDDVRDSRLTVAELLQCELAEFAHPHVPPDIGWITTDEDGAMPNPLALAHDPELAVAVAKPCFMGPSHGDLHFDNVLVRMTSSEVAVKHQFWLIDLAGFEHTAPLSRDVATLLVSILAHRVHHLDASERDALLEYVVDPEQRPSAVPGDLAAVVEVLHSPGEAFTLFDHIEFWRDQLQASIAAAALRHTTYDSVGPDGRWWCLRLAGRMARTLTPGRRPDEAPLRLTPELFGSTSAPGSPRRLAARLRGTIINQEDERAALRSAVFNPGPGVILVHGAAGVGKSALIDQMIADLRRIKVADLRHIKIEVIRYNATGHIRPDAMTIMEDLENNAAGERLRPGESVLGRLTAALDALDMPVAIVIDQADTLLDPQTYAVVDDELDEALDLLAAGPGERKARVILVARRPPRSARDHSWAERAARIEVKGLHEPSFARFLETLEAAGDGGGLATLEQTPLDTLCERLEGNPAQASLAHLIVSADGSDYDASTLVADVERRPHEEVPQFLADTFMEQLNKGNQIILAALSAFGAPVQAGLVAAVVDTWLKADVVAQKLQNLARQRVIVMHDGHYGLPPSDTYRFSCKPPVDTETWLRMLHTAAREIGHAVKPSIHDLHDLHLHFVLIDVLLRAERFESAQDIMDVTEEHLRRWDQEFRLLGRREYLKPHLTDRFRAMSNLNDLGDLYTTRGRYSIALNAYEAALGIAAELGDSANQLSIRNNLAAMHLVSRF